MDTEPRATPGVTALRRFHLGPLDQEIVLTLAWAAPLLTHQLYQVLGLSISLRALRQHLQALQQSGLLRGDLFYRQGAGGKPPRRVGCVWSLTDTGADLVDHSQEPRRPLQATRRALLNHDLVIGDVLVFVLGQQRATLSGLSLHKEVRLDAQRPRPICDAILILRTNAEPETRTDTLPWTARPPVPGDERVRGYALEVDRNTEPAGVLRDKGRSYAQVAADPDFAARAGRMPAPFWIMTHERRLWLVHRLWHEVWPSGFWLLTTDAWLSEGRFFEYRHGQEQLRTWAGESYPVSAPAEGIRREKETV